MIAVSSVSFVALVAQVASNKMVIGDIDDMSGLYVDVIGPGVEAAKLAIEDFGGSVFGNKIDFMVTDHQHKPQIGSQKFREWADCDGLTMVLGGSNTGVSIARSTIAGEKKTPFFGIGAAGASLPDKDRTPYTVHYAYDTTALGNGTATTMVKQGAKSWVFFTADYSFGTKWYVANWNYVHVMLGMGKADRAIHDDVHDYYGLRLELVCGGSRSKAALGGTLFTLQNFVLKGRTFGIVFFEPGFPRCRHSQTP